MPTRRSVLGTVATGVAAGIAGCGFLGSDGDGGSSGPRWVTTDVGRVGDAGAETPSIESALARSPSRAAALDDLSENVFPSTIYGSEAAPVEAIDRTFHADLPPWHLSVGVGDFSADEATGVVPAEASEVESDLEATVHAVDRSGGAVRTAHATADGVAIDLSGPDDRSAALEHLETVLAATDGEGESMLASGPDRELRSHLEDGLYGQYSDLGTEVPEGFSIAVDDGVARRRAVWVYESSAAARESTLLSDAGREAVEARAYSDPTVEFEPFDSFDVSRDGRVLTTEATLPVERLHGYDVGFPLDHVSVQG